MFTRLFSRRLVMTLALLVGTIAPLGIPGYTSVAVVKAAPLYTYITRYYSDATYTTLVGYQSYNECFPRSVSWGTTSPYYQEFVNRCDGG